MIYCSMKISNSVVIIVAGSILLGCCLVNILLRTLVVKLEDMMASRTVGHNHRRSKQGSSVGGGGGAHRDHDGIQYDAVEADDDIGMTTSSKQHGVSNKAATSKSTALSASSPKSENVPSVPTMLETSPSPNSKKMHIKLSNKMNSNKSNTTPQSSPRVFDPAFTLNKPKRTAYSMSSAGDHDEDDKLGVIL
jgi:hypothetical protein